ncbi:zinc ABC transporter substrate-binding protein [Sediminimonas sp.]|uniref:zinc ABC transporter substrate-binding protein n=1 Tax=Sediminimonas sp. TaxID=2823379 RepID=UPI0025F7B160|nr:zinc ABC transporter substrate-binding protein [Sediminimonas sp.]
MSMHVFKRGLVAATAALALATPTWADVPAVATDIAPVHSLVARVMEGVGTPDMVMQPGASPHGYAMRPSEARALEQADIVFWVGADLTPALERAIETLAADAHIVALLDHAATASLEFRTGVRFDGRAHEEERAHADDGAPDHDDDHGHGGIDPHAWLDPENGKAWLDVIAAELSRADPDNAGMYSANAAVGKQEVDAATADIAETLAPLDGLRYIVFHDAYQYFEARFDIPAAGAVSLGDATDPSPARVAELRATVADLNVTCAFAEPQFNPGILNAVLPGDSVTITVIDPLGTDIDPGPDFYPAFLRAVGASFATCR